MSEPTRPAAARVTAPAPLDVVQAFVNTRAITATDPYAREDLYSPTAWDAWWREHAGPAGPAGGTGHAGGEPLSPTKDDLELAIRVREGLRGLLARHNSAALDADAAAIERLEAIAATLPMRVTFAATDELVVPAGTGTGGALAGLLARTVRARAAGTWERLKVCRDPHCREAFYDTSKNHSGTWCSMSVCGARAKQRGYIDRRRQQRQRG